MKPSRGGLNKKHSNKIRCTRSKTKIFFLAVDNLFLYPFVVIGIQYCYWSMIYNTGICHLGFERLKHTLHCTTDMLFG